MDSLLRFCLRRFIASRIQHSLPSSARSQGTNLFTNMHAQKFDTN